MPEFCLKSFDFDAELCQVLKQAKIISQETKCNFNSTHLLLALFTVPNAAKNVLLELGIDEEMVLKQLNPMAKEREETIAQLLVVLEKNARKFAVPQVTVLHLLLSLLRVRDSLASYLLSKASLDLDKSTFLVLEALSKAYKPLKEEKEQLHITMLPQKAGTPFDLDARRFSWLARLGRNLTAMAYHRQIDMAIGREREIAQIIDILGKRRANNPCLVGFPGVGKTAIVEGLAMKMAQADPQVAALKGKALIELDMSAIIAGTSMRGSLSERMQGLKRDVEDAHGRVVVFIDEIHTLMKMGASDEAGSDAVDGLKSVLARGNFPCIGSTTAEEYQKYIESDPAFARRLVKINVEEPSEEESIAMITGTASLYERYHGIKIKSEAIEASVQLAARYIYDRKLPGKAIDLLDFACSRAKREQQSFIDRSEIAKCCSDLTNIPQEHLLFEASERLCGLEKYLQQQVFGQDEAIAEIAQCIRRGFAGFFSHQPTNILLVGPTGVGKSKLAQEIAHFLFGSEKNFLSIDLSEFSEAQSTTRLVGSPPGFIGYEEGGLLTDFLQKTPHCLILLENLDHAHYDALNIVKQLLKDGKIYDSKGNLSSCKNAIIIMTCQLSLNNFQSQQQGMGFSQAAQIVAVKNEQVFKQVKKILPNDIYKHLLEKCVLSPLSAGVLRNICEIAVQKSLSTMQTIRRITLKIDEEIISQLSKESALKIEEGAWPVAALVKKMIDIPVAEAIMKGSLKKGAEAILKLTDGQKISLTLL